MRRIDTDGMETPPETRLSDAERDAVALRLREAAVDGRLTLAELSERLERAYGARTSGELEPVVADLPATPTPPARRAPRRWLVSIMGGHAIRGRFRVSGPMTAIAIMGGCDIDLRDAEVDTDEVVLRCVAVMGGVNVVVPERVEVDERGFALLGGREIKTSSAPALPGTPLVRVRTFAFMGGISVRSKPRRTDEGD